MHRGAIFLTLGRRLKADRISFVCHLCRNVWMAGSDSPPLFQSFFIRFFGKEIEVEHKNGSATFYCEGRQEEIQQTLYTFPATFGWENMLSVAPKIDQLDKFLIKNFPVKTE